MRFYPVMDPKEIEEHVWKAIASTINKFRENPGFFFTESDITSYLWHRLYSGKLAVSNSGTPIYLVHREYPTSFRFKRSDLCPELSVPSLIDPSPENAAESQNAQSSSQRGHYDLVVLKRENVETTNSLSEVVRRNLSETGLKVEHNEEHLLFAIELKYIVSSSIGWVEQIRIDNEKLKRAQAKGAKHAVNLVFCNINPKYLSDFKAAIHEADTHVCSVLSRTYYASAEKNTVQPVISNSYQGSGRTYLKWKAT